MDEGSLSGRVIAILFYDGVTVKPNSVVNEIGSSCQMSEFGRAITQQSLITFSSTSLWWALTSVVLCAVRLTRANIRILEA
jgi:hypothetical protein